VWISKYFALPNSSRAIMLPVYDLRPFQFSYPHPAQINIELSLAFQRPLALSHIAIALRLLCLKKKEKGRRVGLSSLENIPLTPSIRVSVQFIFLRSFLGNLYPSNKCFNSGCSTSLGLHESLSELWFKGRHSHVGESAGTSLHIRKVVGKQSRAAGQSNVASMFRV